MSLFLLTLDISFKKFSFQSQQSFLHLVWLNPYLKVELAQLLDTL